MSKSMLYRWAGTTRILILVAGCSAMNPMSTVTHTKGRRDKCIYKLHRATGDRGVSAGSGVYCQSGLCPPFCVSNSNAFEFTVGIEFEFEGNRFVRPASVFKVTSCHRLDKDVTYSLSHPENFCLIDAQADCSTSCRCLDTHFCKLCCEI